MKKYIVGLYLLALAVGAHADTVQLNTGKTLSGCVAGLPVTPPGWEFASERITTKQRTINIVRSMILEITQPSFQVH